MSNSITTDSLLQDIRLTFTQNADPDKALESVLQKILAVFACPVGTIHILDSASNLLLLRARRGIPDSILDKVKAIPIGKGMAGIAAERKKPVQVCNLQTDSSGVAKPGAKDTKMEGSITIPMMLNGEVKGTLGIAKPVPYEFSDAEGESLMQIGALIVSLLK